MIYSRKTIPLILVITSLFLFSSCESDRQSQPDPQNEQVTDQPQTPQPNNLSGSDLRNAALNGDLDAVRNAIGQGVDVEEADELDRTALMFAAYNGHAEIVQLLVKEGSDINKANSEGRTPLMFAASGPFPESVDFLLQNGADPNAKDNVEGWTPLMYAAAEGNREVVELLLEHGADASLADADEETAIDFAANNGHSDVVTLLKN